MGNLERYSVAISDKEAFAKIYLQPLVTRKRPNTLTASAAKDGE